MTKERLTAIKHHWNWQPDSPAKADARELLAAVDDLMAENAALRNFASPVSQTDKETAFYQMADEMGWKFKDVKVAE